MNKFEGYMTHQKSDGYAISVSKVVPGPVDILYNFWNDEKKRK
jgi:hypothetical protein